MRAFKQALGVCFAGAILMPQSAHALDSFCLAGFAPVEINNGRLINQGTGRLEGYFEILSGDLWVLRGPAEAAYRVLPTKQGYNLVHTQDPNYGFVCYWKQSERDTVVETHREELEAQEAAERARLAAIEEARRKKWEAEQAALKAKYEAVAQANEAALEEAGVVLETAAEAQREAARQRDLERQQADSTDYTPYITETLAQAMRLPRRVSPELATTLTLYIFPDGEIDRVEISESSGDKDFDRSVMQAAFRVQRFEKLGDVDPDTFQQRWSKVDVTLTPSNANS